MTQADDDALDEVMFRAAADPVYFSHAFLDWHPFPKQSAWLAGSTCPENYLRAGNRFGKTLVTAMKHLWMCTFKHRDPSLYAFSDPYRTVSASLSLDQAQKTLEAAWRMVNTPYAENYRKAFIRRKVGTPYPRIEFLQGETEIWGRSTGSKGKYLEGSWYNYGSIDEAALDKDLAYIIDEILLVRLLDQGGMLDVLSVGKRGSEFNRRFERAKVAEDQFAFQAATWDNLVVDQKHLTRLRSRLSPELVEERLGGGERAGDGLVSADVVQRAIGLFNGESIHGMRWESLPIVGRRYTSGWDLAKESHFVVGWTFDATSVPYRLVAFEKFNKHTIEVDSDKSYWEYVDERIRYRAGVYPGFTTIDSTGLGLVIADFLADISVEALNFTGRVDELIGLLALAYGLGFVAHPVILHDATDGLGGYWSLVDELEEVESQLSGLDVATSIALSLWPMREVIRGAASIPLAARVGKYKEAARRRRSLRKGASD
jgi:hypothetical protein